MGVIWGLYRGEIGVIWGLYAIIQGSYGDN